GRCGWGAFASLGGRALMKRPAGDPKGYIFAARGSGCQATSGALHVICGGRPPGLAEMNRQAWRPAATVELQRTTGAHFGTVSREGRSPKPSEGKGALVGAHKIGISCPRKTPRLNHARGGKISSVSAPVAPGGGR